MLADLTISGRDQVADWIETTLLVRGSAQIGLDQLHSIAAEEVGASEATLNLGLAEMGRRQQILGNGYPFAVVDGLAVRALSGARFSPYSALLLMSPGSPGRALIWPQPPPEMVSMFEKIVVQAMRRLLGTGAEAVRFGWPGDEGRPPEFNGAIAWLADRMGIQAGAAYRPPRRKDGGVDVVAWRPFRDRRSGFPVALVQCTLQEDVTPKAGDIDLRVWSGWLTLDTDPMTVLAVPGTIPPGETWNEIALRCLILERLRIVGLLESDTVDGMASMIGAGVDDLGGMLLGAEV